MTNIVEELKWRGMIHDIMPGTEEQLLKESTAGYVGMDPTADSLHIGHLVSIMMLKHLQLAGHKPLALVGGATGMIGDPSGKSQERNLLTREIIEHNVASIKNQLAKFLDYDCGETSAEIVDNYDWYKNMSFLEFIRDAGKHISVNYMMAKDSVKKRLETGLSFTEFTYQLVQGWDFYHLFKHKKCLLQMGGSDQWGNIVTGTELIRRKEGGEAFALTCPLITKADGTKFGKTEDGAVWLDPEKTSPYKFYQFWINVSDEDAKKYIKIFTLKTKEVIDDLIEKHEAEPHLRLLQKAIADELTTRVHSEEDLEMAHKATEILFSKKPTDALRTINEKTLLQVFEGVPQIKINKSELADVATYGDLMSSLTNNEIFKSKGEAKRMIKDGGVRVNKVKIDDAEQKPELELLQDKFLLVQKGRRNYYLVMAE